MFRKKWMEKSLYNVPAIGATMFTRFDAQHDAGIGENNRDGIDYRDG